MKKQFLPLAMVVLAVLFSLSATHLKAQIPGGKAPNVAASLTVQPNLSGLCIGQTVTVPIHITGDGVLSMNLYLEFDHSVLAKGPGSGYANLYPDFNVLYNYNYSGTYPTVAYLDISSNGLVGTNFNGEKLIDLVFVYQGGSTAIHFRRAPDPTPPPICKMFDEFGTQILPVTYTDNTVTGYPNLSVGAITASQTICSGSAPAALTGTAPSNGTSPTYQWQSSADNVTFADITGATTLTYAPGALTSTTYFRLMQNATATCGGPLPTNTVTISVNPLLPVSVSVAASANPVCTGLPVTFTATPVNGGAAPVYLWKVNGTAAGTNSPVYTYTPANNDVVTCELTSNATCPTGNPATSNAVTVSVTAPAPVSVSIAAGANPVCQGSPVTFTATPVNGGASPSYAWFVNGTAAGTNNPAFTFVPVNNDVVTCVMTSSASCISGSPATSNAVTVTVNPPAPAGISIAVSANPVCAGTEVTFTATPVNGGATPGYQWQSDGHNIAGAIYSILYYTPEDGEAITCVMTSSLSCVSGSPAVSNTILMTMIPKVPVSVSIAASANPVCQGTTVTYTATPVNGGTTPAYQWKVNGAAAGGNSATFAYAPAAGDVVTCVLTSSETCTTGNPAISNAVSVTVNPSLPVSVSVAASANPVCAGTSVTFTATPVNGGASPAYAWTVNGSPAGGNSPSFTYVPANNDAVVCVLTSDALCATGSPATSNTVTMTVNPVLPVSVVIAASSTTVCAGTPVIFSANAFNGGTAPAYAWFVNGLPAGTNNAVYSYTPSNGDVVTCVLTSNETCTSGNPATSNAITMTVNPLAPVSVTIASSANPVCAGTPVTFTATGVNGGTTPLCSWFVNGIQVPGVTAATYTYTPSNGDPVQCALLSSETCATGNPASSNVIITTVNPVLPVSVSITASANPVCGGTVVNFTATPVNGGITPAYQWFVNGIAAGANVASYSYAPANGDLVTCVLTSSEACAAGSPATSNAIAMATDPLLQVGTAQADQTICSGAIPALLTSNGPNNGTSPVYQWQSSLDNNTFANINGATLTTYQPGALTQTTYYRQLQDATGTCGGPLSTNSVTITVNPVTPAAVAIVASANPVCQGTSVTFTATPTNGGATPSYQWYVNGIAAGLNSNTYIYAPANGDIVTCQLTSSNPCAAGNPAMSNAITVTVNPILPVSVTIASSANPVCTGSSVTFTATPVNGGLAPAFQWYLNGIAAGSNSATYTLTPSDQDAVYCVLTSSETCTSGNPATSNTVTMTVIPDLLVGAVAADQTICSGTVPALLTSNGPLNGTAPVYQWQSSLDNNTFANINGATLTTYQPDALTQTTYYRQMQNASGTCGGPLATNTVTVTVNPVVPVSVSVAASANPVCVGTSVTYTATPVNGGAVPALQWFVNGTPAGSNNAIYSYIPADGDVVTCQLTSSNTCATGNPALSNAITMTVNPVLVVGAILADQTICSGIVPALLTSTGPMNGTSPVYQWQSSADNITFSDISGATLSSYQPAALTQTTYFRLQQNAAGTCGGPLATNTVTVTVNPNLPVSVSVSASGNAVCAGTTVTYTATSVNGGLAPVYAWFVNGIAAGMNSTTYSYIPSNGDVVTCQLTSSEVCTVANPVISNALTMTVNPILPVSVTVAASANPVCTGSSVTFTATPVNGGTTPSYQWYLNGSATGGNSATFTITPADLDAVYCVMTSSEGCTTGNPATSNTVTMTVIPNLVVGTIAADQSLCAGSVPALLTSNGPANGTSPVYQWQSSLDNNTFSNINGATLTTYQPDALMQTTYYRQLQNATGTCGGPLATNTVTITVNPVVPVSVTVAASGNPVCVGTTVTYTATAVNGGTVPAFQWFVNGTPAGVNSAVYSYVPADGDVVTCQLTSSNPCATGNPALSNAITMTVNPVLLVGSILADQTICSGVTPSLLTSNGPLNGTSPSYQWQSSLDNNTFANVNGATLATYQPGALTQTTYYRQQQDAAGTCGGPLSTNTVTITVNPNLAVSVVVAASANPVCDGTSVTFTATAVNGGVSPVYAWFVNGIAAGANATTYTYVPVNGDIVTCQLTSSETCTVSNPVLSNAVTITVNPILPVSVSIAVSANPVCTGGSVTFTATPVNGGTTPSYQWYLNGSATGNNSATYTFTPVDLDAVYCVLTSSEGCTSGNPATSNTVTMSVTPDLVVGTIAADQTLCAGSVPALLTSNGPANGTSPVYQWQSSLDNNTFSNINGATLSTYQPGALTQTTHYRQLQNAAGTCGGPLATNTVTININPILPVSVSVLASVNPVCTGNAVTFTATPVNGGITPVFQWFVNGAPVGGNTAAYSYTPANLDQVYCQLTSSETCTSGNPATSNTITMDVYENLVAGTAAADQSICQGTAPALLTSTGPLNGVSPTYQWQSSLDNLTFANINGATTTTYQPGVLNQTTYYRQVQNAATTCGGPLNTNTVTITVIPNLLVGTIGSSQTICTGTAPALLTGTAPLNGTSPVYQWQLSNDNVTFADISGATDLNFQPGVLTSTTYYRLMQDATGTCTGPLATNTVVITVNPDLVVGSISADQTICSGAVPAQLNGVPPANGSNPTYQWQSSPDNVTFTDITGAVSLNYQPGAIATTTYFRLMQNSTGTCGGPLPTNTVTITTSVLPLLIVGTIGSDQAICPGNVPQALTGTAPANGVSPTYQWQSSLDNVTFANISGATALTYQPGAISVTTYFHLMQDAGGTCGGPLPTNVVTISINPNLAVGSISASQAVCPGGIPSLLTGVAPSNGTAPTYQWQSSLDNVTFANINGATALNYQPGAISSVTYFRQMQNAAGTCGGPLPTNTVTISINPGLLVGSIAASQSVCSGTTPALLTGVPPSNGTSPTYQWQSSLDNFTFANINGATQLNYQPGVLATTTYFRQMQNASNACGGPLPTNSITITVNPPIAVGSISASQAICYNAVPAQLIGVAPTGSIGPYTYQWQNSPDNVTFSNIAGATNLNYQPGALTATTYYRQIQSSACGTPVTTNTVTITVNPLPVPTISGPASACVNSTGNVYTTQSGMTGYTWIVSAGGTITAGAGTNAITVTWTTAGAQTVSVNYTNGNNCTAAAPVVYNVTVNALPTPTITGPAAACVSSTGNVYTTQTGMSGYTWTVSAGGTITAGAGTNAITVTWNTAGAQTVSVNYTNGNSCTAATPTVYNVTVNPLPVPTITGPASVCVNSTGNIYTTQTGMTGYTWTVSAGGTITAGAGTNAITVTWTTTGAKTVTVNYTNGNSCSAASPTVYNVTVNALPTPTITGPASACVNSTGNVYTTQTGMTGYTWTVSAGGTITAGAGTSAITVTWNTAGAQNVSVNYANGNSCTAATPTVYNVTVNTLPTPTITGPASACVNSTGNIYTTQTGMTGYTWTVSAGGTITAGAGTNAITVTWTTTGAKTVTVNYLNGNGCTAATPTVYNVTVNALPTPTITGPASACVNSTGNVYTTQTGMTGYTWVVTGGTVTAGAGTSAITVTWNVAGPQTVSVNYANASNCTAATPTVYNVTVNAIPTPTVTGPTAACQGTTATYTTQTGMTNYTWTISAGGTIVAGGTPTSNTVTVQWNTIGAQTVSVNYTNVCPGATPGSIAVTVSAAPVPTIGSMNNPCVGSTDNIYYTETGMTGYVWTVSAGGTIVSGQGTATLNVTWNVQGIQTVTVNYANAGGCFAASPTVYTVFVNSPPPAAGPINGTATVCAGTNSVIYTTTPVTGATSYTWSVPAGATIATGAGSTSITVNFGATAVSGNITVAATNLCGNGPASTFPVTVNPLPAAAGTITGPASVCSGSTYVYTVPTIANATSYVWTLPAGATGSSTTSSISVTFTNPPASGVITVKGTNACGSGAVSPNFNVTINPVPVAVVSQAGNVLTCTPAGGSYQWYYEGTAISGATSQSYTVLNNTGYYWCVVTVNGCSSAISNKVWVTVVGTNELPDNAGFTIYPVPNNGKFTASVRYPVDDTFTIMVYNMVGEKLYELKDVITVGGKLDVNIDIRPVAGGMYSVVFVNSEHRVVKKIIVK